MAVSSRSLPASELPDVDRVCILTAVHFVVITQMAEYFQDEQENNRPKSPHAQAAEICPLCGRKTKLITCQSCISSGDFSHSTGKYSER